MSLKENFIIFSQYIIQNFNFLKLSLFKKFDFQFQQIHKSLSNPIT